MQAGGIIKEITTKPWDGITLYSLILEGDREFYRTGTIAPACSRGDYVEFQYEQRGRNRQVDLNTLTIKTQQPQVQQAPAVPVQQAPQTQAYRAPSGGGGYKAKAAEKDAYWSDKEARDIERQEYQREVVDVRINYSASQRDAIEVVKIALQHEAIPFGNAAKGARLGIILESIDEVTARFVAQRTGKEVPEAKVKAKKKAEAETFAEEAE